jgi:hypothetical protein
MINYCNHAGVDTGTVSGIDHAWPGRKVLNLAQAAVGFFGSSPE